MNGKYVLVTGGCGFIGSHFIRLLREKEPTLGILNLDSLTYAAQPDSLKELEQKNDRYQFFLGDIQMPRAVDAVVDENCQAIFNFAAETHVGNSVYDAGPFVQTNIVGTYNLLEAAKKHKVKRFIQISTDEVYGTLPDVHASPFDENSPVQPNNPYSASKAAAECLVRAYANTYHLGAVITRCSNNYGPGQHTEKLIPKAITHAIQGKPIPIYGDGLHIRDWIWVGDHCLGIYQAWKDGRTGHVYNFGGHAEKTNLSVVKDILEILHKPETLIAHECDRNHDRRYAMNTGKAGILLDWRTRVKWKEGIRRTIAWYAKQLGYTGPGSVL